MIRIIYIRHVWTLCLYRQNDIFRRSNSHFPLRKILDGNMSSWNRNAVCPNHISYIALCPEQLMCMCTLLLKYTLRLKKPQTRCCYHNIMFLEKETNDILILIVPRNRENCEEKWGEEKEETLESMSPGTLLSLMKNTAAHPSYSIEQTLLQDKVASLELAIWLKKLKRWDQREKRGIWSPSGMMKMSRSILEQLCSEASQIPVLSNPYHSPQETSV